MLQWPDLDVPALRQTIRHKKRSTTGGLDGVSLSDLKCMPDCVLHNFVDMFKFAEDHAEWPVQVVSGRVSCIPKHCSPETPSDYRPITVLGLLYRCWSSFHAKHFLRSVDAILPIGLYGNRPMRHATQVWAQLLWAVEHSYQTSVPLFGIVADLQKAFNLLPRQVVLHCALRIGAPFPLVQAWTAAMVGMGRHFQIGGQMGPAIFSSTGCAEGDALSCVGMLLIDVLLHEWMLQLGPSVTTLTYVDDWQWLLSRPEQVQEAFTKVVDFTSLLDLSLDAGKTFCWSTSNVGRHVLRRQGFGTVLAGRNLGAHVQLSRKHTNKSQMDRLDQLASLWPRLQLSSSPYSRKLQAVRMAAWPRALHGIGATTLSGQAFRTLRTGAVKALGQKAAGASPVIQLGLIELPTTDPWYWSLLQTLRLARECGPPDRIRACFSALSCGLPSGPANGVTATLAARIRKLGWRLCPDGRLADPFGTFDLFISGWAELVFRAELAWPVCVSQMLDHRHALWSVGLVDLPHTWAWMKMLSLPNQGAFRKLLSGAHITQDSKQHCGEDETSECPYCLCTDGRFHRFWQCEHFGHLRQQTDPQVLSMIHQLPEVLTSFGWSLKPSTQTRWLRMLSAVVDSPLLQPVCAADDLPIHLFTDGTCAFQPDRQKRYAAWGVLQACLGELKPVDVLRQWSGCLPGIVQSAYRAEATALLRAFTLAAQVNCEVFVWTDCQALCKQVAFVRSGKSIATQHPHADLWRQLAPLIRRCGHVTVMKVASHVEAQAVSPLESWAFYYNGLVDKVADQANQTRSAEFWSLLADHVQAVDIVRHVSREVQQTLLRISLAVLRDADAAAAEGPAPLPRPVKSNIPLPVWDALPDLVAIPAAAVRWYGESMVRLILSWFWGVLQHSRNEDMAWISCFQLYVDFQMQTGHPGPVHVTRKTSGQWFNPGFDSAIGLQGHNFKTRCRWFSKVFKESLRHAQVSITCGQVRPNSHFLSLHCGCVALPWPVDRVHEIDRWFQQHLSKAASRGGQTLDRLPVAVRNASWPALVELSAPVG